LRGGKPETFIVDDKTVRDDIPNDPAAKGRIVGITDGTFAAVGRSTKDWGVEKKTTFRNG
jgi:hypothetical protein